MCPGFGAQRNTAVLLEAGNAGMSGRSRADIERIGNMRNSKKTGLVIIIAAAVLCAAAAAYFIINAAKKHEAGFADIAITAAESFDARGSADEPHTMEFSAPQLEELAARLAGLGELEEDDRFGGSAPLYRVSATLPEGASLRASGYSQDGDLVDIEYKGSRYVVTDPDFLTYLSLVCMPSEPSGPVTVTSEGKTAAPYVNWLWAKTWSEGKWLAGDGASVMYTLPELAAKLPELVFSDDFVIKTASNTSFSYLSVYDESFERLYHNDTLDRLNALPPGIYYVSIAVTERGAYVPEGEGYETSGYECVFKLIVEG